MTIGVNSILDELLQLPAETEWFEFKEAKNTFHFNELGQYFSALSNEANLKGKSAGWLVFGVEDKTRQIVGSQFRPNRKDLDHLKEEIANQTNNRMTFDEIRKSKDLIEGRRPNIHVSTNVDRATDTMVDYLKKRGIDKSYCQKMIIELLQSQSKATRQDFEKLLLEKLSDVLDASQKKTFIKNLLQEMRHEGIIRLCQGKRGKGTEWELSGKDEIGGA